MRFLLFLELQAKIEKTQNAKFSIAVSIDQLKDADISPIVDIVTGDDSDVDAVDIVHKPYSVLSGECITALMRAINFKLRVVDLQDMSLGKEFLRSVFSTNKFIAQFWKLSHYKLESAVSVPSYFFK